MHVCMRHYVGTSEDDVLVVQMLEGEHDGRRIEPRRVVREAIGRPQMREELAADHILHSNISGGNHRT